MDSTPELPEPARESAQPQNGERDARLIWSQLEVIRDVMLAASECGTWLTLGELRHLTGYGEASISAQLRNLRRAEFGGHEVAKRQREGAEPSGPGPRLRINYVWEYRIAQG